MRAEDRACAIVVKWCAWAQKHFSKIILLFFGAYNILCFYSHTETVKRSLYWNPHAVSLLGWVQLFIGIVSFGVYLVFVQYKINPSLETIK